ncbi:PAS domain-containing sensor histidine kinase [Actinoplanes sp. NPDC049118]|uniref:sensor histidine kinase n=1 Tax=Actinoplanes sp. NPDC049118 TaxID=3155769 RepID=UPI0033C5E713
MEPFIVGPIHGQDQILGGLDDEGIGPGETPGRPGLPPHVLRTPATGESGVRGEPPWWPPPVSTARKCSMTTPITAGHARQLPAFPDLLSAALDAATDGLAVVDAGGRVLFRNRAARRFLGGASRCEFRRPDGGLVEADDAVHTQALRGVVTPRMDVAVGDRIAEVTAEVLPGGETVVLGWRDVTAARQHADVLAGFAQVIAHDLRNPLCVVEMGSAQLGDALAEVSDCPARREAEDALDRIGRAAARMQALIGDLLADVTAAQAEPRRTPVMLGDLVSEVAAGWLDLAAGASGPVPWFTIGELPVVLGDMALLRQLLENLIGNAVKYTAPGVVPHVTVRAEHTASGSVAVHVDDNGIGVPVGERAAVFNDFHRAGAGDGSRAGFPGFGLGLGICRRIVERHGGTIRVDDNPAGAGSRFTITLPGGERDIRPS